MPFGNLPSGFLSVAAFFLHNGIFFLSMFVSLFWVFSFLKIYLFSLNRTRDYGACEL